MLDDPRVLRAAVADYRTAATTAGLSWPEHVPSPGGQPPDLVHRLFAVDQVADQLVWLQSQVLHSRRLLPDGGYLMPWPTGGEALDDLSLSVGTPFFWRHQLPLFHFDVILYTFVLAGEQEGEIWRYEISPDAWDAVRAATSLAALFTEWTKGITADVITFSSVNGWLQVGDGTSRQLDLLREHTSELDLFAFPVSMSDEPLLRARQRACGIDMSCIDRGPDCHEELLDAIDATRASLGL